MLGKNICIIVILIGTICCLKAQDKFMLAYVPKCLDSIKIISAEDEEQQMLYGHIDSFYTINLVRYEYDFNINSKQLEQELNKMYRPYKLKVKVLETKINNFFQGWCKRPYEPNSRGIIELDFTKENMDFTDYFNRKKNIDEIYVYLVQYPNSVKPQDYRMLNSQYRFIFGKVSAKKIFKELSIGFVKLRHFFEEEAGITLVGKQDSVEHRLYNFKMNLICDSVGFFNNMININALLNEATQIETGGGNSSVQSGIEAPLPSFSKKFTVDDVQASTDKNDPSTIKINIKGEAKNISFPIKLPFKAEATNPSNNNPLSQEEPSAALAIEDNDGGVYEVDDKGKTKKIGNKGSELPPIEYKEAARKMNVRLGRATTPKLMFKALASEPLAFDEWQENFKGKSIIEKEYQKIGENYYVPIKFIPQGMTGKVQVDLNGINKDSIIFKTPNGSVYTLQENNILSIAGAKNGDGIELYAQNKFDSTIIYGKLNIYGYEIKNLKVNLVPVNSTATIEKVKLENELNKIYYPYGVSVKINVESAIMDSSWDINGDNKLAIGETKLMSRYTDEMSYLNSLYEGVDNQTVTLFYLPQGGSDASVFGDMPIKSQYGYLFQNGLNAETIAHELLHGYFQLNHTFDNSIGLTEGSSDNLMDYPVKNKLYKYQWDLVHDRGLKIFSFLQDTSAGRLKFANTFFDYSCGIDALNGAWDELKNQGTNIAKFFSDPEYTWTVVKGMATLIHISTDLSSSIETSEYRKKISKGAIDFLKKVTIDANNYSCYERGQNIAKVMLLIFPYDELYNISKLGFTTVINSPKYLNLENELLRISKAIRIKKIESVLSDEQFLLLSKDIKYLPGPKLPNDIIITFENSIYINRKLLTNEKFYKYHGVDNRTGKKYSWFTNRKYITELELRQKLAIRDDWNIKIEFISEFNVPSGTWISEGKAAAQGVGYPGQDYQAVILNTPEAWIIRTDKAFK